MKRFTAAGALMLSVGFAGILAAQAGQNPMPPAGTEKDTTKPVTVSGCVAESGGMYTLTNAMMADDMKKMSASDMKASGKTMSYMLMGGDLKAHVGHRVEVTGAMAPMTGDKMAGDKMGGMKAGTLNVKSVKMVSPTCP